MNFYPAWMSAMGRLDDAIALRRRGLQVDPLSLIFNATLGLYLDWAGHHDEGLEQVRNTIEMDPSFIEARLFLGWNYERRGLFDQAIGELSEALSLSGGQPHLEGALGHTYAISGQKRKAEEVLVQLEEQAKQRYVAPLRHRGCLCRTQENGGDIQIP
jgi:tetratricopeptide (TPR) repeat protein